MNVNNNMRACCLSIGFKDFVVCFIYYVVSNILSFHICLEENQRQQVI